MQSLKSYSNKCKRSGFTLVELLVSVSIILILATLSISAVVVALDSDRVSGSARQIQSYLEGARDRAIYADGERGVRFIPDENDSSLVTSMIFIGPTPPVNGTLILDPTATSDFDLVQMQTSDSGSWAALRAAGLLQIGNRIQIANSNSTPASDGAYYTIIGIDSSTNRIRLSNDHFDLSVPTTDLGYILELSPGPLSNQEPALLSRNIVIDLDQSRVPGSWGSVGSYIDHMDVMFSPRGTVTGSAASRGLIHFALADRKDVDLGRALGQTGTDPKEGEELIVTLFTRTGNISRHPVNITDADSNGLADDPFFFAETGATAK